ncbi:MAG: aminopeptidase, partial [Anaerolineae bacterium]
MADPRVTKLAQVLVHYSLNLQPNEEFVIRTSPLAQELTLAVYKEAILAGAHPLIFTNTPGGAEIFFKHATDAQIDYISPVQKMVMEQFTATLSIGASHNSRERSGVDPARQSRASKANAELTKIFMERSARNELKWCVTVYPTNAAAQDADMSLSDYENF